MHFLIFAITSKCLSILVQAHLSPECIDLLNRIFVIDEKERISLQQIKAHPWYNKPMLAKHTHAEKQIATQQAEIQKYISTRQIDPVCLLPRQWLVHPDVPLCNRILQA